MSIAYSWAYRIYIDGICVATSLSINLYVAGKPSGETLKRPEVFCPTPFE